MKGKSHSPEQIVSKLREVDRLQAEEGLSIAAAAKRVEVAEWTIYRWRKQYAGMSRDEAKRLKDLEIQTVVDRLAESAGGRTANKCRSLLSNALKQAVLWELIPRNPVDAVAAVKTLKRQQVIWTTADAVKFLAEARTHRLYALFYTVMATGLRHGEALALPWDDVQADRLQVTASKTPKGARVVGLTADVRDVLDRHRERQVAGFLPFGEDWSGSGLVCTSEVGTKLDQRNVTRLRHDLEAAAGVPHATMHDLRHLNVSLRRKQGQDAKLVADQIGHTDPAFTVRLYTPVRGGTPDRRHRSP